MNEDSLCYRLMKKMEEFFQTKLVSGISIKTVNDHSLLGEGNIVIQETGASSEYGDLIGKPKINGVTLVDDVSFAQLQPDYEDLQNTPYISQRLSDYVNDAGFLVVSDLLLSEDSSNPDYAKIYTLSRGNTTIGTINIPKDLVVQEGTVEVNPAGYPAGTYLKLVLNNDDVVYIDSSTFIDQYTADNSGNVTLTIDNSNNTIKAEIDVNDITPLVRGAVIEVLNEKLEGKIGDVELVNGKLKKYNFEEGDFDD